MRAGFLVAAALCAACGPARPAVTVAAPPVTGSAPIAALPVAGGLEPGTPVLRLPKNFVPAGYAARLVLDPADTGFVGEIAITGEVAEVSSVIWLHALDLGVTAATASNGSEQVTLTAEVVGPDFLRLRAARPLAPGTWTLALAYSGRYELLNTAGILKQTAAGASYLFTQFEAVYARRAFPCVDEPDSKVPWQLTLDVPAGLVAVANTPIAEERALVNGHRRVVFAASKPLPAYLVAFGVGPFELVSAGTSKRGVPVRIVTLAGRGGDAAYAAQTAAPLLDRAEAWFGTPYPYEKLDLLTIPITVGFGAMENAGLITFAANLMLMEPALASKSQQYAWLGTAAHEIAHQWFGNLVTAAYWDDIWLNEAFATWVQWKLVDAFEPALRADQEGIGRRAAALALDALATARRIRQPITVPDDINNVFDGITYGKGAALIAMIERHVGVDVFQRGVRAYLAARAWGNATSRDFISAITEASGTDVTTAFESFLDQAGAPELTTAVTCADGQATLAVEQRRYLPPGAVVPAAAATPWTLPLCIAYEGAGGKRAETCTVLAASTATIALPGARCPRWVMPNAGGAGYFRVGYTPAQLASLRDRAWRALTAPERYALAADANALALTGRLPLTEALSLVPKLPAGTDRFAARLAAQVPLAVEPFVDEAQRAPYERYLRATFGRAAARAGLLPKRSDSLDLERARLELVGAVAWTARDPKLVAAAVQLAARWRELPELTRGLVLRIAVDADPARFAAALREVRAEPEKRRRDELLAALGSVRDPARQREALALLLDPAVDIRETMMLGLQAKTAATQAAASAFYREHQAAIRARLPTAQSANPIARVAEVHTRTCRAEERDAVVAYLAQTYAPMAGGPQTVRELVEGMDQCIARRALLQPAVTAWLAKLR